MDMLELASGVSAHPFQAKAAQPQLEVRWARHADEVEAAQRLRYRVFAQEMGANLHVPPGTPPGLDVDEFDAHCEHLLVMAAQDDEEAPQVLGTYRVMLPDTIRRLGRCYTDSEFDLTPLGPVRHHMAELGRSCIDAQWRSGGVMLMLWSHLIRFLVNNGARHAIGCASVPMQDGGVNAARVWNELRMNHMAPEFLQVRARHPLPVHLLPAAGEAELPPLVKGYIRCGAQLLGSPAWDADFGTADLPMLLDFDRMPSSYRRRFLGI